MVITITTAKQNEKLKYCFGVISFFSVSNLLLQYVGKPSGKILVNEKTCEQLQSGL